MGVKHVTQEISNKIIDIIILQVDKGMPIKISLHDDCFDGFSSTQVDSAIHQFLKTNKYYDLFYDVSSYEACLHVKGFK